MAIHDKVLDYNTNIIEGKVQLTSSKLYSDIKRTFEKGAIEIRVRKKRKRRSILFNSWYWSVLLKGATAAMIDIDPISNGNMRPEEVHTFFKRRFLDNGIRWIDPGTGETDWIKNPTTTTLTNTEFIDYVEKIFKFGIELLNCNLDKEEKDAYFSTLEEPKHWKEPKRLN